MNNSRMVIFFIYLIHSITYVISVKQKPIKKLLKLKIKCFFQLMYTWYNNLYRFLIN